VQIVSIFDNITIAEELLEGGRNSEKVGSNDR
jgi:hypothetical protein